VRRRQKHEQTIITTVKPVRYSREVSLSGEEELRAGPGSHKPKGRIGTQKRVAIRVRTGEAAQSVQLTGPKLTEPPL
jgi:hypothetical protein